MGKSKRLIIVMALAMALCLSACGGSDAGSAGSGASGNAASSNTAALEKSGTEEGNSDEAFSVYGRYEAVFVVDDEDEMYPGDDEYLILNEDGTLELFLLDEAEHLTYELDGDEIIVDGETIGWYEEGTVAFDIGGGWTVSFAQEGAKAWDEWENTLNADGK